MKQISIYARWMCPFFLMISYGLFSLEDSLDAEIQDIAKEALYLEALTRSSQKECLRPDKRCPTEGVFIDSKAQRDLQMLLFLSFSAPLETWKSFSKELEQVGGSFVLRGLPNDSFQDFALKVKQLKEQGVHVSIQIDPEAFEHYQVQAVPTLVLTKGDLSDQLTGNLTLSSTLKRFSDSGQLKTEALILLEKMQQQRRRDG